MKQWKVEMLLAALILCAICTGTCLEQRRLLLAGVCALMTAVNCVLLGSAIRSGDGNGS